jgi:hypothetical protein
MVNETPQPMSPNSPKNYHYGYMDQPHVKRKSHYRTGSAPPETDPNHPQPFTQAHIVARNGSLSYTNSVRGPFLSSSASSMTGTSIRTELDGSIILHPNEDHPGKMYWESLFQPDRAFNRRPPRHPRSQSLHKSSSVFSFASAATNPQCGSALTLNGVETMNLPPRTTPTPNVNRYDVLTSIKSPQQNEKPVDKKQFEKLIVQEKGLSDELYNDNELKAIFSQTQNSKSSPPSLLEEGTDESSDIDKRFGKWYFWLGFLCPLFWLIGGAYPSRGRTNRIYLTWRRRNRVAFTVFMTLLVVMLIVGLILKPDFLGVRTSSSSPSLPNVPDGITPTTNTTSPSNPNLNPHTPVNAADVPNVSP